MPLNNESYMLQCHTAEVHGTDIRSLASATVVDACRARPIRVVHGIAHAEHDAEGRVITAEYPSLFFVTAYVPNAGEGLKRLDYRTQEWDAAFAGYLAGLSATKPVILAGDLNVAHQEIDIHNPKSNKRSAGFTNVRCPASAASQCCHLPGQCCLLVDSAMR